MSYRYQLKHLHHLSSSFCVLILTFSLEVLLAVIKVRETISGSLKLQPLKTIVKPLIFKANKPVESEFVLTLSEAINIT